jgi:hypothetical protein
VRYLPPRVPSLRSPYYAECVEPAVAVAIRDLLNATPDEVGPGDPPQYTVGGLPRWRVLTRRGIHYVVDTDSVGITCLQQNFMRHDYIEHHWLRVPVEDGDPLGDWDRAMEARLEAQPSQAATYDPSY